MFAIKANRQYAIDESEKQKYIARGYKIATLVDGKLVFEAAETPESKELAELKDKIKTLEAELDALNVKQGSEDKKAPAKPATTTKGEGK